MFDTNKSKLVFSLQASAQSTNQSFLSLSLTLSWQIEAYLTRQFLALNSELDVFGLLARKKEKYQNQDSMPHKPMSTPINLFSPILTL